MENSTELNLFEQEKSVILPEVRTEQDAENALIKLKELRAKLNDETIQPQQTIAEAQSEIERCNRVIATAEKKYNQAIDYIEKQLIAYYEDGHYIESVKNLLPDNCTTIEQVEAVRFNDKRQPIPKNLRLINGTISRTKGRESVAVEDEKKAIAYCQEHCPDLIRTKTEINKTELKKHYEKTKELPDGVKIVTGAPSYTIDTGK